MQNLAVSLVTHTKVGVCSGCVSKHVLLDLAHHDYPLKHLVQLMTRKRAGNKNQVLSPKVMTPYVKTV